MMTEQEKLDEYSRETLRKGMEWMKKYGVIEDKDQPRKPYIVTFELRARNIIEAVELAHEIHEEIVSVVQKHRMTNVGTEWYNPEEAMRNCPETKRLVTLSWVTDQGNSNTAKFAVGDKLAFGTQRHGVEVTVYVDKIE